MHFEEQLLQKHTQYALHLVNFVEETLKRTQRASIFDVSFVFLYFSTPITLTEND